MAHLPDSFGGEVPNTSATQSEPLYSVSQSGFTRFDLLGDFGRFNWLGNFYIVILYNMLFAGLTTLCLVKKFTWAVQAELIRAFGKF